MGIIRGGGVLFGFVGGVVKRIKEKKRKERKINFSNNKKSIISKFLEGFYWIFGFFLNFFDS